VKKQEKRKKNTYLAVREEKKKKIGPLSSLKVQRSSEVNEDVHLPHESTEIIGDRNRL